jgi:hypothetical protein
MPEEPLRGIDRSVLLQAIEQFDPELDNTEPDSTRYALVFNGKRYPPQTIVRKAAHSLSGELYRPEHLDTGQAFQWFRVLRDAGFEIALKTGSHAPPAWLFQGNPERFDIDDYLARYSYVYWSAPRQQKEIQLGDRCVLWRAGDKAGAIAIGRVAEVPLPISEAKFPECLGADLWRLTPDPAHAIKVGIEVDECRLDEESGFIPRSLFVNNPILSTASIIRGPQGTVFRLQGDEFEEFLSIWNFEVDYPAVTLSSALEGAQVLRWHLERERNPLLVKKKKDQFAAVHNGRLFCEICGFDFSRQYPAILGDGFIEVHHLAPLSQAKQARRTTLEDLLLVCSNCHRMVHRSTDVDGNLQLLREHYGQPKTFAQVHPAGAPPKTR